MSILKKYEFVYDNDKSPLKPSEVLSFLETMVEVKKEFVLESFSNLTFDLYKRPIPLMRDSFNPVFHGKIIEDKEKIKVKGWFGYYIGITAIAILLYILGIVFFIFDISLGGLELTSFIPLFIPLFITCIMLIYNLATKDKRNEMLEIIETVCHPIDIK